MDDYKLAEMVNKGLEQLVGDDAVIRTTERRKLLRLQSATRVRLEPKQDCPMRERGEELSSHAHSYKTQGQPARHKG